MSDVLHRARIAVRIALLAAGCVSATRSRADADDWPQWLGPRRDGVWRETGILDSIPAGGLHIRWRARVGNGYSGPAVAKGRVYVTDHVFDPEVERLLCFDESTGKPLWKSTWPVDYRDMEYGNGPRATPTVHDGKVFVLGTQGDLLCLNAETGDTVWKTHFVRDLKGAVARYGASPAPLEAGGVLVVVCGGTEGCVAGLDLASGAVKWRAVADEPAYSAPVTVTAGGREQTVVWTANQITSLDAATGAIFWHEPRKAGFDAAEASATPVVHNDRLLCLSAWSRGSLMMKLAPDKPAATVAWKTRQKPTTTYTTPLFRDDGHFYAVLQGSMLACLNAETGDEIWATSDPIGWAGNPHLTPNGDRVFLFNSDGSLTLATLTPDGYQGHGRTPLVEPTTGYRASGEQAWAHPAYANRHIFVRSDRELVCASLAAGSASTDAGPARKPLRTILPGADGNPPCVAVWSADGARLIVGNRWGSVRQVDAATGKDLAAPPRLTDFVFNVALSRDGTLASVGGSEFKPARNGGTTTGQVRLFDTSSDKPLGDLKGHTSAVFAVAFSPDGKTLATGGADRTVRLWDVATREPRHVVEALPGAVNGLAFSPDGAVVASVGTDGVIRLWDATTGRSRREIKAHEDELLCVAFSPDGKTLATGDIDGNVRLWNVDDGAAGPVLRGHRGRVASVAWSHDGKMLATGGGDEAARLWSVAAGREIAVFREHRGVVGSVAFSPDGKTLATAAMRDAVRLWAIAP